LNGLVRGEDRGGGVAEAERGGGVGGGMLVAFEFSFLEIEDPIVGDVFGGVEVGLAMVVAEGGVDDFDDEEGGGGVFSLGFGGAGEDGEVGFGFGVVGGDERELAADGEVIGEGFMEPVGNDGNGEGVGIVLGGHGDDFSLDELNALAVKEANFGHAVILIAVEMFDGGFGDGHACTSGGIIAGGGALLGIRSVGRWGGRGGFLGRCSWRWGG